MLSAIFLVLGSVVATRQTWHFGRQTGHPRERSVSARIEDEKFWAALSRLGKLGISGGRLVTFMSGSVAAGMEDETLWAVLS